ILLPRFIAEFASLRDGVKGPETLACADVEAADVAGNVVHRRRRGTGGGRAESRPDDGNVADDHGRRSGANHAGLDVLAVQTVFKVNHAVSAEARDRLASLRASGLMFLRAKPFSRST